MSDEPLRTLVENAIDAFNGPDRVGFLSFYAPDVVLHGYPAGAGGREDLLRFHSALWTAFPDVRLTLEDVVTGSDRAAIRYTLAGTHSGDYLGTPATGRQVSVMGLTMVRVAEGRVVEEWHAPTELSILVLIGAVPAPALPSDAQRRQAAPARRSAFADAAALRLLERDFDADG